MRELSATLKPRGVLFCSNPRGNNEEGLLGDRFGCHLDLDTWRDYVTAAGFLEVRHYYRPRDYRAITSRGSRPYGANHYTCTAMCNPATRGPHGADPYKGRRSAALAEWQSLMA